MKESNSKIKKNKSKVAKKNKKDSKLKSKSNKVVSAKKMEKLENKRIKKEKKLEKKALKAEKKAKKRDEKLAKSVSKNLPKLLKKEFKSEKQLNRKVLKKVSIPKDKEFVKSLFVEIKKDGKSFWKVKESLSSEEMKDLKRIFKEIKKGKGKVKKLPLITFSVIVALVLVFAIFIKNPLAESLSENALEKVFGATVNIDSMRISILKGGVKFKRLQVADENNLEYNLFEVGRTNFKFSRRAFFLKKFVVSSMVCKDISWDTKRKHPGKLTNPQKTKNSQEENLSTKDKIKKTLSKDKDIKAITEEIEKAKNNPQAYVEEKWKDFESPVFAEKLVKEYTNQVEEQKQNYYKIEKTSQKVIKKGNSLVYRDYTIYENDPLKIPSLVKDIADFSIETNKVKLQIEKEIKDIEKLEKQIQTDRKILEQKMQQDIKTLQAVIPSSKTDIEAIFNKKIEEYLIAQFGSKYTTAKKIHTLIKKYQARAEKPKTVKEQKKLEKKRKEKIRKQKRMQYARVVPFQSFLPDFALVDAGFSSQKDPNAIWDFNIKNITSEPEKWGKPISMDIKITTPNGAGLGDLKIDLREGRQTESSGGIKISDININSQELSSLGITNLKGKTKGNYKVKVINNNKWQIKGNTIIYNIKMQHKQQDRIATAIYNTLKQNTWNIAIEISGEKEKEPTFKINFNLAQKLKKQVGNILKQESAKHLKNLENAYLSKISSDSASTQKLQAYHKELKKYQALLNGDISELKNISKQLDQNLIQVKKSAAQNSASSEIIDDIGSKIKSLF